MQGELGASLECGGLAPLWPRSSVIDNKAAPGRRTPGRRPSSRLVLFNLHTPLCRVPFLPEFTRLYLGGEFNLVSTRNRTTNKSNPRSGPNAPNN